MAMDELDLFHDFNRGVSGPSGEARRRASASLTGAIEGGPRPATRVLNRIRKRRRVVGLAFAALSGVAVAALFVDAPWKSSPGFLDRAQAALTPPAGSVVHMKWDVTRTSPEFGCTLTIGPNEWWADQTSPYRYRLLNANAPPRGTLDRGATACTVGPPIEMGGTDEPPKSVRFEAPNRLIYSGPGFGLQDPVESLRTAIADGIAHHDGRTELDGQVVERIRFERPSTCLRATCPLPEVAFVDPETLAPVQIDWPNGWSIGPGRSDGVRFDIVLRFETYEVLPRTAANLALTDIRAQHPNAIGP
jgi:hypothetical protein